jgi:hypothetical protein
VVPGEGTSPRLSDVRPSLSAFAWWPPIYHAAAALEEIELHAASSVDGKETGGILLGQDDFAPHSRRKHGPLVRHAVGPGPAAERTDRSFRRDYVFAQEAALNAFIEDQSVWIGEWHTHLAGGGRPSQKDLVAYLKNLADPRLGMNRFLSIIVLPRRRTPVGDGASWRQPRMRAWIVSRQHLSRARLVLAR